MPDMLGQFTGTVDAAGDGMVTIIVDPQCRAVLREGQAVQIMVVHTTHHLCDWRFVGRRQDRFAEVVCIAPGHDTNTRLRVAPLMVADDQLPKYDGQFDV